MTPDRRSQLRRNIRLSLHRYKGGHFSIEGGGGNQGMLMFNAPDGKQWFCGGLNVENAGPICDALNGMVELMDGESLREQ